MTEYQINPKTNGSRVVCCVPQAGRCFVKCSDCFFQPSAETGESRAYLGPNYEFTPNVPTPDIYKGKIVRINDCNDSNYKRDIVMATAAQFVDKFFNTSIPKDLAGFIYPVVLTLNPGSAKQTDTRWHKIDVPDNLMFVRLRVNSWNLDLVDAAVEYYAVKHNVPVIFTYMAYYETPIPDCYTHHYTWRERTKNSYWVINPEEWDRIYVRYAGIDKVRTCGKDAMKFSCTDCRNCENFYRERVEQLGLPTEVDWS